MILSKRTIAASAATLALVGAGMAFATFGNTADETGSTGGVNLTVAAGPVPVLPPNVEQPSDVTITNSDITSPHDVDVLDVQVGSGKLPEPD